MSLQVETDRYEGLQAEPLAFQGNAAPECPGRRRVPIPLCRKANIADAMDCGGDRVVPYPALSPDSIGPWMMVLEQRVRKAYTAPMTMRLHCAAISLLAVSACAGPIETRIAATGAGVPRAALLALRDAPGDPSPIQAKAREAVMTALQKRGHGFAEEAPMIVEIGVSARPAALGLSSIAGDDPAETPLSGAKPQRLLQSCTDQTYRLVVSIFDRTSGTRAYHGSAEEYHCKAGLDDTVALLAEKALADIERPAGPRIETRRGRE